jgi:hypothetical protein
MTPTRWLRGLVRVAVLAVLAVILGVGVGLGRPGGAGLVLLWMGSLNAQALWLEQMVLAPWRHDADPTPRPAWRTRWCAWAREVRCSTRRFGWVMPWAASAWPDRLAPTEGGKTAGPRGVLLIHGYLCNRGVWNDWYPRLAARGVPWIGVDLAPVFSSIDAYADTIDAALARLQQATGQAPLVVCHSMGGLVLRAWRQDRLRRGVPAAVLDARVHQVITIGTPHRGTWLARWGRQPNAVQMRLDSPWLQALAASESPAWRARFTCLYSDCDNVVFPPRCATLDGAAERLLAGRGHLDLIDDPRTLAQVLAGLSVEMTD